METKNMPRVNAITGKRRPVLLVKCQQESNRSKISTFGTANDVYGKPKPSCTLVKMCSKPNENSKSIEVGNEPCKNGKILLNTFNSTKDETDGGSFTIHMEQIEGESPIPCIEEREIQTTIESNEEETKEDIFWTYSTGKQKEPQTLMLNDLENSERYLSIECGQAEGYTSTENRETDFPYSSIDINEHENGDTTYISLNEPKNDNLERYMSIETNAEHELNISYQGGIDNTERYMSIDPNREYEASTSTTPDTRCLMPKNSDKNQSPVYTLTATKRPRKTSLYSRYQESISREENSLKELIAASYNAETMPQGLEMGLDPSYENQHMNIAHNVDFGGYDLPVMNVYTVTEEIVQTTPLNCNEFSSTDVNNMSSRIDDSKSHFEVVEVLVVRESEEVGQDGKNNNIVIVNKSHNHALTLPLDPSQEADGICHYMRYENIDGRRTKVFECGICHRGFKHQYTLMRHLPTHTDERNFPCEVCGKAFRQMSTLIQHGAIHSNARPYRCEICSNTFNRVSTLISHKKTHTGNKPHVCTYCGKRFHQKGNLRNHVFTHTNERPYKCEICAKGFNQKSNLICHRIRYHTAQQEYECEICNARFSKKHALKSHQFYKHAIQFATNSGRKKLADKTNLGGAMQTAQINKNVLQNGGVSFDSTYKEEPVDDYRQRVDNKEDPFILDLAVPHLVIDPIKSKAYATATALGQIAFALYKPFDGPERLMRVAPGQQQDKQMLFQATVEDLKATQVPAGGNFSQSTPHQFTVQTVATFVEKIGANGQLEIEEEPDAHSCCQIKIEPMYHGMALSAEITGWQDLDNVPTSSVQNNPNQTAMPLANYSPYDSFMPNAMWNTLEWENQLRENANNYENKLILNAQECYTFSQGNQHFNAALNTEFEPSSLTGAVTSKDSKSPHTLASPDPLEIGSSNQFDGLSSYVEYNYMNQDDAVQLSLQTLEVASEPAEASALGSYNYLLP